MIGKLYLTNATKTVGFQYMMGTGTFDNKRPVTNRFDLLDDSDSVVKTINLQPTIGYDVINGVFNIVNPIVFTEIPPSTSIGALEFRTTTEDSSDLLFAEVLFNPTEDFPNGGTFSFGQF